MRNDQIDPGSWQSTISDVHCFVLGTFWPLSTSYFETYHLLLPAIVTILCYSPSAVTSMNCMPVPGNCPLSVSLPTPVHFYYNSNISSLQKTQKGKEAKKTKHTSPTITYPNQFSANVSPQDTCRRVTCRDPFPQTSPICSLFILVAHTLINSESWSWR